MAYRASRRVIRAEQQDSVGPGNDGGKPPSQRTKKTGKQDDGKDKQQMPFGLFAFIVIVAYIAYESLTEIFFET